MSFAGTDAMSVPPPCAHVPNRPRPVLTVKSNDRNKHDHHPRMAVEHDLQTLVEVGFCVRLPITACQSSVEIRTPAPSACTRLASVVLPA